MRQASLTLNRGVETHLTDPNFHASLSRGEIPLNLDLSIHRRAAHNLIFFLFSARSTCLGSPESICIDFGTMFAEPYCQRACYEGTKKPIGWGYRSKHRDRRSVSRSPSVVATGGTYSSISKQVNPFCKVFWKFFMGWFKSLKTSVIGGIHFKKTARSRAFLQKLFSIS